MLENSGLYWRPSELKRLVHLRKGGLEWQDVGRFLGRTASACQQRFLMVKVGMMFFENDDKITARNFKI